MKALISPNEKIYNYDEPPIQIGIRIAEIAATDFPVCEPLFWVDCEGDITAGRFYYNDGLFFPLPEQPQPETPVQATDENGPVVI
jgi:hypothetical protein